ncbi:mRNA-capping enzyme [Pycnococcus provasolii]
MAARLQEERARRKAQMQARLVEQEQQRVAAAAASQFMPPESLGPSHISSVDGAMGGADGRPAKRQKSQAAGVRAAALNTLPQINALRLAVPDGWEACPPAGEPWGSLIPSKVPLGLQYDASLQDPDTNRYTPQMAVERQRMAGRQLGLVIDLTNSSRYYNPQEFSNLGVERVRVPCVGRDECPSPEAISAFCFYVQEFQMRDQIRVAEEHRHARMLLPPDAPPPPAPAPRYVLVHCTHGFNRTGTMIVNYFMRMSMGQLRPKEAIVHFRGIRSPGIYKPAYVAAIFDNCYERRSTSLPPCERPAWKRRDDEESGPSAPASPRHVPFGGGAPACASPRWPEPAEDDAANAPTSDDVMPPVPTSSGSTVRLDDPNFEVRKRELAHDNLDSLGEVVDANEEEYVRREVWRLIEGKPRSLTERLGPSAFPGAQPISLDRANLREVVLASPPVNEDGVVQNASDARCELHSYYVTWKADGTRYMLYISKWGVYVMNRKFEMRRLQMRFPVPPLRKGQCHDGVLLDGEMINDVDRSQGVMMRRYLVYDMMSEGHNSLCGEPFAKRYKLAGKLVLNPKKEERDTMERALHEKKIPLWYHHEREPFKVRLKDFFPASRVRKLFDNIMRNLSHKHDGVVLQDWAAAYVRGSTQTILKWKPAHENSVDFEVEMPPLDPSLQQIIEAIDFTQPLSNEQVVALGSAVNTCRLFVMGGGGESVPVPDARLTTSRQLVAECFESICRRAVIECYYDTGVRAWAYMRSRTDKMRANHESVFRAVVRSIEDNLTEDELIAALLGNPKWERGAAAAAAATAAAVGTAAPTAAVGTAPFPAPFPQESAALEAPSVSAQQPPPSESPPPQPSANAPGAASSAASAQAAALAKLKGALGR